MAFYKAPRYVLRKLNVLKIIDSLDIKDFVDVGCGAGELACDLVKKKKLKGTGLDFSKDAIKVANGIRKSRGIPSKNLRFIQGDQTKLGGNKYDLVMCFEVLEHVKNDKALLKKLIACSKKYVLISVPAKQRLFDSSDAAVGHFRRYERNDLVNLIESANLNIVTFLSYGYPFTNIVRVGRKVFFKAKLLRSKESTVSRTKGSGINPVKLPAVVASIDIEKATTPFYYFSRLFNKTNLSEGYLVLCEKKR